VQFKEIPIWEKSASLEDAKDSMSGREVKLLLGKHVLPAFLLSLCTLIASFWETKGLPRAIMAGVVICVYLISVRFLKKAQAPLAVPQHAKNSSQSQAPTQQRRSGLVGSSELKNALTLASLFSLLYMMAEGVHRFTVVEAKQLRLLAQDLNGTLAILNPSGELQKLSEQNFSWEHPFEWQSLATAEGSVLWPVDKADPSRVCVWKAATQKFKCVVGTGEMPSHLDGKLLSGNAKETLLQLHGKLGSESLYILNHATFEWKRVESFPADRIWSVSASSVEGGWLVAWYSRRSKGGYRVNVGYLDTASRGLRMVTVPQNETKNPVGLLVQGPWVYRAQGEPTIKLSGVSGFSPFSVLSFGDKPFIEDGLMAKMELFLGAATDQASVADEGKVADVPERNTARLWKWKPRAPEVSIAQVPYEIGEASFLRVRENLLVKIKDKVFWEICSFEEGKCSGKMGTHFDDDKMNWSALQSSNESQSFAYLDESHDNVYWKRSGTTTSQKLKVNKKKMGVQQEVMNPLSMVLLDTKHILLIARQTMPNDKMNGIPSGDLLISQKLQAMVCRGGFSKMSLSCVAKDRKGRRQ
jgi:hypothetical protein